MARAALFAHRRRRDGEGPRAFLLCGGTEQGEDLGYGPARYFDPAEIAQTLSVITTKELWSNFDPEQMAAADIYGANWDDELEADLREEFTGYFKLLKKFVAESAKDGSAMQITMT